MAGLKINHKQIWILFILISLTFLSFVDAKKRKLSPNSGETREDKSSRGRTKVKDELKSRNSDVTREESRSTFNTSRKKSLTQDIFTQRMRAKNKRIFAIQQQILSGLGMMEQPNFTAPVNHRNLSLPDISSIHWAEEEEEEKVIHRTGDDYLAKSVQALSPSCQRPAKSDEEWTSTNDFRLYFNIEKDVELNERVQFYSSTLWLYKKPMDECDSHINSRPKSRRSRSHKRKRKRHYVDDEEDHKLKITVYRYLRPVRKDKKEKKELVSSYVVEREHGGWVKLDMKSAVEGWLDKPKKNFGILVVTEDSNRKTISPHQVFVLPNCSTQTAALASPPLSLPLVHKHGNSSQLTRYKSSLPALDIYTVVKSASGRLKRASHNRKQYSLKRPHCGTEEMYVKFEDLGWQEWIIQPQGFKHVTCKGSCTRYPRTKYFRRIGKSNKNNFKRIDHLCCGPVKFKSLKVIHLDAKQDIKLSIFEDFLITECGCLDGGN